jgi:hypothetical protein
MQGPRGIEVLLARVERGFGKKNQGYFNNYFLPMKVNRQGITCQQCFGPGSVVSVSFWASGGSNSDPSISTQKLKNP